MIGAGAPGLHQLRSSQTMPQLNYTRADIQEQYLGSAKVRHPSDSAGGPQAIAQLSGRLAANKRAKSSERHRRDSTTSEPDQNDNSSAADDEPADVDGRGQQRAGDRKRRRRSHSASRLFSACFHIPTHLSSMLPAVPAAGRAQSHKRSILAHLRLGGGPASPHQTRVKRPISASQTADNLRQVVGGDAEPANASASPLQPGRKHVSFESQRQQQVSCQQASSQLVAVPSQQQATANSSTNPNVITRNYQAHSSQQFGPTPGELSRPRRAPR